MVQHEADNVPSNCWWVLTQHRDQSHPRRDVQRDAAAALHSGVASPDLPGMLSVKLDPESPAAIQKLARQLHALDCVEYATIMETLRPASVSLAGPAPVGSCAVTNVTPPLSWPA